jgi:hypothetical protein
MTFVVFYVGIYGEKPGGTIIVIAGYGFFLGGFYHKRTYALITRQNGFVYRQLCYLHGGNRFEGIVEVVEFLLGEGQFYRVHDKGHIGGDLAGGPFP